MAEHARLAAPPPDAPQSWPWHKAKCGAVSVSAICGGDRRLEAETYLSHGFGVRIAIEKQRGWSPFGSVARIWMPGRLKGIQVSRDFGTPFLAATQVFDFLPVPRKWLALERTADSANRFVKQGTILVTCSGSVGRTTVATRIHESTLISHDLLRIESNNHFDRGWLYAFLHSVQTKAMATGAHYGHIIKHLEPEHVQALPVPLVDRNTAERFNGYFDEVIALRNKAHKLTSETEEKFEEAIGPFEPSDWGERGFSVKASAAFAGRRRFDAANHNPAVAAIRQHLANRGEGFTSIQDAGYTVWLPTRFRRIPATDGVQLVESSALVEVNPTFDKRIADTDFGDPYKGRVTPGWILVARSGQVYGINGTAVIAGEALAGHVISDDVIRVAPQPASSMKAGYLWVALSHPILGRPIVKAMAYGSSIPHIEPADIASLEIVRLPAAKEGEIAEKAEEAAQARAAADLLERRIESEATEIIDKFMAGTPFRAFVGDTQQLAKRVLSAIAPDA